MRTLSFPCLPTQVRSLLFQADEADRGWNNRPSKTQFDNMRSICSRSRKSIELRQRTSQLLDPHSNEDQKAAGFLELHRLATKFSTSKYVSSE